MRYKDEELVLEFVYAYVSFGSGDERTIVADARFLNKESRSPAGEPGVTIKGRASESELQSGLEYRFVGRWREHHKHGWQFCFDSFVLSKPSSRRGIVAYLKTAPGIGPGIARRIYDEYGSDSVESIRLDPLGVAHNVERLSPNRAQHASEFLTEQAGLESSTVDLLEITSGLGIPSRVVRLALKKWGARASEFIRRNPFHLMSFPGVGFLTADRVYASLGGDPAAIKRQALAIENDLATDRSGSTYHPASFAAMSLREKISGAKPDAPRAVRLLARAGRIATYRDGGLWISLHRYASAEDRLADSIRRLASR